MKDNIFSWFSGLAFSSISMINGWITVETTVEVLFYGFIGGLAGMFGKWIVHSIRLKLK